MVKRYKEVFDPNHSQECICHRGPMTRGLEESPDGDFVDIEDYEELKKLLARANERVAELEKNQLPIENGKNRYGLDVSYFRNVINRELNRPLDNYKPDELARVLARLSRTADESVMFEPEFSNKFAIEKKIEFKNDLIKHLRNNYTWTHSVYEFIDSFGEQLRKGQEQ